MSLRNSRVVQISTLVVQSIEEDRITFLAAGIAFYAFLSIFPLLLLVLVLGSVFGGETFAQSIVNQVSNFLTPEAESLLDESLRAGTGRSGASIVGLAFLLWSSLRVFRGLDIAFSQIYTQSPNPDFLETVRNAVLVFSAIGIAVIAIFVLRGYLLLFDIPRLLVLATPLLVFLTISVVFYPMYYVFPNEKQPPLSILPGTLLAALGVTILGELFGIYASLAGTYALFGLIGGVLLLLVWFYFGAIILLLGAVVNAILAGKYQPSAQQDDAVPITESGKHQ